MTQKTITFNGPFSIGSDIQRACNVLSLALVEASWSSWNEVWTIDVKGKHAAIVRLQELLRGGHQAIVEAAASRFDRTMNGYLESPAVAAARKNH